MSPSYTHPQRDELRHRGPWSMMLFGAAHPISQCPPSSSRHWSSCPLGGFSRHGETIPGLVPQPMCGSVQALTPSSLALLGTTRRWA